MGLDACRANKQCAYNRRAYKWSRLYITQSTTLCLTAVIILILVYLQIIHHEFVGRRRDLHGANTTIHVRATKARQHILIFNPSVRSWLWNVTRICHILLNKKHTAILPIMDRNIQ